jgi:hypothetical protein
MDRHVPLSRGQFTLADRPTHQPAASAKFSGQGSAAISVPALPNHSVRDRARFIGRPFAAPFKIIPFHDCEVHRA